jgi:polysaccharide chain length determinant protein (PEP-CTERM system associated)
MGWAVISKLPNQYESSARMYLNTDAVLTPLLKGLAVDSSPDAQLKVLQSTLLSRPNIETLISKTDLDFSVNTQAQRDALATRLMTDITVKPDNKLNLFTIQYSDPNPKLARDVVQTLLTIFIESATGGNRRDMQNARIFLQHQIASYEQQLRVAEGRRAEFRAKYPGLVVAETVSGSSEVLNPVETLQNHITQLEGTLQTKLSLAAAFKKELETTKPTIEEGAAEHGGSGTPTTLAQAEAKLRLLRLTYTDQYPEVITTQQLVNELKASATHGGGGRNAPNPAYETLKLKLIDVTSEAESLKRQLAALQENQKRLQELEHDRPALIAEYQNINRGYSVLRKNYDDLLARLQSANIGEAADTQADKVQIRIVDPPIVPTIPSAPNRILFISLVLVAGLAAGASAPILLSQLDRSFWVVEDLRSLGLPVLGGISLLTGVPLYRRLLAVTSFGIAVVVLISLYGGLMFRILRASAAI